MLTYRNTISYAAVLLMGGSLLAASSALTTPAFAQRGPAVSPRISSSSFNISTALRMSNSGFGNHGIGQGLTNKASIKGFNPQPDPPGTPGPDDNKLKSKATIKGFNPQPDPPGKGVADPDDKGFLGGVKSGKSQKGLIIDWKKQQVGKNLGEKGFIINWKKQQASKNLGEKAEAVGSSNNLLPAANKALGGPDTKVTTGLGGPDTKSLGGPDTKGTTGLGGPDTKSLGGPDTKQSQKGIIIDY